MKVVIAGSGAMGATFGSKLLKAGHDVTFLDFWQDNIDAINTKGIVFHDVDQVETLKAFACKPEECHDVADLVIVFTKSMGLRHMLESVKHLVKDHTKVLCLLNGLGHVETLSEYFQKQHIVMGVTVLTASMIKAGEFACGGHGNTELGGICSEGSASAKELVEVIKGTGLPCELSSDIMYSIWRKACINGTMNCLCAILDCNMLTLGQVDNLEYLLGSIVKEFALAAKVQGTELKVDEITKLVCWYTTKEFKGVMHYPSMHQDLVQHHRYTEIDYLNGYVNKVAKANGFQTPFCDLLTLLVHAKEHVLIGGNK